MIVLITLKEKVVWENFKNIKLWQFGAKLVRGGESSWGRE